LIVRLYVPVVALPIVPVIIPVVGFRVSPEGKLPLARVQLYGDVPPFTLNAVV
jgi:hypothetical protein